MEKASHDVLSIGFLKLPQKKAYQRQRKVDATGMLKVCPVVCLRANHAFKAHIGYISNTLRGYRSVRQ
jgi:hypothetical protein